MLYIGILILGLGFSSPLFVKEVIEQDKLISLEIYKKSKRCGSVDIDEHHLSILISCGFKSQKALLPNENVELSFDGKKMHIRNTKTGNVVFSVNCKQEYFDKVEFFLQNAAD